MHSSRGTTSLRVWQCGALDRLFSTYLCKYFVTLPIYHPRFFRRRARKLQQISPSRADMRRAPACNVRLRGQAWRRITGMMRINYAFHQRDGYGTFDSKTIFPPRTERECARFLQLIPSRGAVSSHSLRRWNFADIKQKYSDKTLVPRWLVKVRLTVSWKCLTPMQTKISRTVQTAEDTSSTSNSSNNSVTLSWAD